MTICYVLGNDLYINLTNRCTNRCEFCVRDTECGISEGLNLWLDREPSFEEIIEDVRRHDPRKYKEVVFCGYGEPMMRFDVLIAVAKWIKDTYGVPIRINTNGHANRIEGRDITPELAGFVDTVSVSLNAKNREEYEKLCHCDYAEEGFDEMLDFTKKCKKYVPNIVMSVVDVISEADIEACRKIAEDIGVTFRARENIE